MKKILLSVFTIAAFVVYAIHQKNEEASVKVVASQNLSSSPTPVATDTPAQSAQSAGGVPPTDIPTEIPTATPVQSGMYKNGTYTGSAADAFYGNIQVQIQISGGKISEVQFLQYPSDRGTSVEINSQAMPYLKQEAIQAQKAQVDIVSGATQSSLAFRQSLQSALDKAKS